MKKFYIAAAAVFALSLTVNAQIIEDNMESYPLGPLEAGHWGTWDGSAAERLVITDAHAKSGIQSGMIGGDKLQDAILLLGNESSGVFTVRWNMYIPAGKTGYYNVQEDEEPGEGAWAINVHFNKDNTMPLTAIIVDDANPGNVVADFQYPENTWFALTHVIDLDTDMVTMYMNSTEVYNGPFFSGGSLGGFDFFSIDVNTEIYIDDVLYADGVAGVSDAVANTFSIYPNPVSDVLNIRAKTNVEEVVVYDALGKAVLNVRPEVISPKIDMSSLTSGMYFVKISAGNNSQTFKVIK